MVEIDYPTSPNRFIKVPAKPEGNQGETSLLSVTDQAHGLRSVQTAAQHSVS